MSVVKSKLVSAVQIFRERGAQGLAQAIGRNVGVPSLQPVLDESLIAWDFFRSHKPPGTMVDVGAHFGGALRPFIRHGWQVFAFEPDAKNRARLLAGYQQHASLMIDPRAVSDQPRQGVTFYRSDLSSGISGLSAFDPSHQPDGKIDVTTLTDFIQARDIKQIDFLKIDTEGHDLFVLRGLPWQQVRPRLVLCEYENHKTEPLGYRYEDLVGYLADQGYVVITSEWYPIERYGVEHRWRQFSEGSPPPIVDPLGWGNVLAVRDVSDIPALRLVCERAARRERARAH